VVEGIEAILGKSLVIGDASGAIVIVPRGVARLIRAGLLLFLNGVTGYCFRKGSAHRQRV
jgi:hypothetical protein